MNKSILFTVIHAVIASLIILLWPDVILWFGKIRNWNQEFIDNMLAKRWHVLFFLMAMEFIFYLGR